MASTRISSALAVVVLASMGVAKAGAQVGRYPNDPLFPNQTSFYHRGGTARANRVSYRESPETLTVAPGITLDLPRAWEITTGSRQIVVAILDDGFFYRHEDIRDNVWRNPGETGLDARGYPRESNGVDDDGNGYVDDVMGWDFAFDDPDPDPYVFDGMNRSRIAPYQHSTPALGIIGAKGNNGIGISGINWDVSLMLLKIGAQGSPRGAIDTDRLDRAVRAIRYAVDNGARIINWSGYTQERAPERLALLREAIRYAEHRNVLIVMGAGNDGRDLDQDQNCLYPQCFAAPNMILVAEADFAGKLFRYQTGGQIRGSNWGPGRVDLAAIGANFSTALRHDQSTYGVTGGTSNAGPVVAGVAALVLSLRPDLTAAELKQILLDSAVPLEALKGKLRTGGIIDAFRAVKLARKPVGSQSEVAIVRDQAEAILAILAETARGTIPDSARWQRLFGSEGYRRLSRRELAMQRPFSDSAFRAFVLSDSLARRASALRETLDQWSRIEVASLIQRAISYLPEGTALRARLYPVIKPRSNSFVFFEDRVPPGIFLYLDPAKNRAQFENTMVHELHHIGEQAACAQRGDTLPPGPLRTALTWMSAFGEGRAMLAAAGGPKVHPHAASPDSDRVRWDRDVARARSDIATLERFFTDILDGRLATEDTVRAIGMSFFGTQGPWYTVGWLMAATIEDVLGRPRLIASACEPGRFLRDYDEAARIRNRAGDSFPRWSESLITRLNHPSSP